MNMQAQASHGTYRGIAQPETEEEKRRRLHREAAADVKYYKEALKESKAAYQKYDQDMSEASQEPHETDEDLPLVQLPKQD